MENSDMGLNIVQTPLSVLNHGSGPTVLLMGGLHCDGYEGQVALTRLLAVIDRKQINGRLSAMHAPEAGVRARELADLTYTPEMPSQAPVELRDAVEGILTANATIGRVKRGDLRLESSREALLAGAT
ncbi:hypothetical protein [Haliea sp.]